MNEFIVWDKEDKKFESTYDISQDGDLIFCGEYVDNSRCSVHQYIGKKDINNKKIYADCSIVEFDKESGGHSESLKGYFRESSPMIFQLVILDSPYWNILYWHEWIHQLKNFKIIDTIQENNLGLIKQT